MKKYQKLAIAQVCLSVLMTILAIIMFFVPSLGSVEKERGTNWDGSEWEVKCSAHISIFDYIAGNHEAPVRASGSAEDFLEIFGVEVNVVEELEELLEESPSNSNDMFYGPQKEIAMNLMNFVPMVVLLGVVVGLAIVVKISKNKGKTAAPRRELEQMKMFYSKNKWFEFFGQIGFLLPIIPTVFQTYFVNRYSPTFMDRESVRIDFVPFLTFIAISFASLVILWQFSEKLKKEVATMNREDMVILLPHGEQEKVSDGRSVAEDESVIEQIKKYHELYEQGILTEEEFNAKKQELLNTDGEKS